MARASQCAVQAVWVGSERVAHQVELALGECLAGRRGGRCGVVAGFGGFRRHGDVVDGSFVNGELEVMHTTKLGVLG